MRKYLLLPLVLLLTACPRPEAFDLTYNGEPYCGGSQYGNTTSLTYQVKGEGFVDPEFPLEITRRVLAKKGFRPSEIPLRMNYQQAVLPSGLVPIGSAYYQEWLEGVSEEETRPLPLSPYNAPDAWPANQRGHNWRAGLYIGLLDPQTMQMVRQRTYSWYYRSYPSAILAGPDGYIYVAGTTVDLALLGQAGEATSRPCVDRNGYTCMEAFVLKIDPETLDVLWEKRLERMQNEGLFPFHLGENLPLMMTFDTQRNHLLLGVGNFASSNGFVVRLRPGDGGYAGRIGFFGYPSYLFWHDQPGGDLYIAGYTNAYLPTGGWSSMGRIPQQGLIADRVDSSTGRSRWGREVEILAWGNGWVNFAMNPMVFPAPEGGLNFSITALRYIYQGYASLKDKTDRLTPVEVGVGVEAGAERSYYGRVYPDGSYKMTTEILYPDPAFADQPFAQRDRDRAGGKFRVTFLEKDGQSRPILGIQRFSCFYKYRVNHDISTSLNLVLPNYLGRDYNTSLGYPTVPYLPQQWEPGVPVGRNGRIYPMWLEIPGEDFNAAHLVKVPGGFLSVTYYHSPAYYGLDTPDLTIGGLTITRYRWK